MRILVTFALEWEFKPWLRLRKFQASPGDGMVFIARAAGKDVRVLLTGIGAANAARAIRKFTDCRPDICIASGLAGGLKPQHRSGEILAARAVQKASAGVSYESDQGLFSAAVECGAKPVDRFFSSGHVVRTAQEKFRLGAAADAVDMEAFAVMQEMGRLDVPCVAVRVVADSAEMEVPCDFDRALDDSGRIRIVQVLSQVAGDPRRLWPLAQLGVRSARAATALARYLERYTTFLTGHQEKMDLGVPAISQ
ncbi:MAG TPA: hypothetical protein VFQ24_00410 [Terriglobia bacterium]|nr:hypothetical protein [Terriglobia bacterium]